MNTSNPHSRRQFLQTLSLAGLSLSTFGITEQVLAEAPKLPPLIMFSKALQDLNYEDTADLVAEVGWDGIECPVRRGGQVLTERVEDDLPRMVETLAKRKRSLVIMTTDITSMKTPNAEKILRLAHRLGIKLYRMGGRSYRADRSLPEQLREAKAELRDLAAFNQELGLCAGFQNHSGINYMGAPVWDIYELIHDLPPEAMGAFFDIGHATVEGGYAWRLHARLMEPRFRSVYVKDFTWQERSGEWEASWCPLGKGMISRDFIRHLVTSGFSGPISQHFEFEFGKGPERVAAMKKDFQTLRSWLAS